MSRMHALATSLVALAISATGALAADPSKSAQPSGQPMQKMSTAQCETLWKQALGGTSGDLAMDKAQPYAPNFKEVDKNGDSKLSSTEWMDGCNKGLIRTAGLNAPAAQPGAPTSDRTPGKDNPERTPGASNTGAAGTEQAITPGGTSDRTPSK